MTTISLKRLQKEYQNFLKDPSDYYIANPIKDDLFCWHFTIKGPEGSEFEGGIYHGVIKLPMSYPYKPPNPNGRFDINIDICLSMTKYHKEEWQAAWTIRSMLEAIIAFMPIKEDHSAIGALDYPADIRKKLAEKSKSFKCEECGMIINLLPSKEKKEDKKEVTIKENINNNNLNIKNKDNKEETKINKINNSINNTENIDTKEKSKLLFDKEEKVKELDELNANNKKSNIRIKSFPSAHIISKKNQLDKINEEMNEVPSTFDSDFQDEFDFYKAQNTIKCYYQNTKIEIENEIKESKISDQCKNYFEAEFNGNNNLSNKEKEDYLSSSSNENEEEEDYSNNIEEKNKIKKLKEEEELLKKNIESLLKKKNNVIKFYSKETYEKVGEQKLRNFNIIMGSILALVTIVLYFIQLK